MCGRFELVDGRRIFVRFDVRDRVTTILDNKDVRPTQQVLVLGADRVLSPKRWGWCRPGPGTCA